MAKKSLAKRYDKFKMDDDAQVERAELQKWFEQKMKSPKVCENCGDDLSNYDHDSWFGSQHHILEKSIFDSIKTHPLNHLVLCRWKCHPAITDLPSRIQGYNCFPKAKKMVQAMYDAVAPEEKRRIPEYFLD